MNRLNFLVALAFLALPAAADPVIVFSISDIVFNPGGNVPGFSAFEAPVSVTGVGTPQNAGVLVNGTTAGFNWDSTIVSSDDSNWYFSSSSIIIEAAFGFSGHGTLPSELQPGDIPLFGYALGSETGSFAVSKSGSLLTFDAPITLSIDPRLAAFYGLAPPCLADPSVLTPPACTNPEPYVDATFYGSGSLNDAGVYVFSGEIDALITPEPSSVVLLITVLLAVTILLRTKAKRA